MPDIPAHFRPKLGGEADPRAVVTGSQVRFTVLTSRLLRLEFAPEEAPFEDRPSQVIWYRRQPVPEFSVTRQKDVLEITTSHLLLRYDAGQGPEFSPRSLQVILKANDQVWHYGDPDTGNLLGTTRTLDGVSGKTPLEPGLLSRAGWTVWDDSESLVFNANGWLEPRPENSGTDLYFFGHGHDYTTCLQDFQRVAGAVPLLPRYMLGNWWSRYWAYTQDELIELIRDFRRHACPLSVCIIDMDWHITQTGNRSSGWTGYTWNRDLFPDPADLLRWLHEQGLRTALNLHPAEGVHPHEEQYATMAQALGIDPASDTPLPFDIADPQFARHYFELLHHPYEAAGVDFWWLDWQQGTISGLPGLDPLFFLNHLHYHDLGRTSERRPAIFSRWGGLGNHRYPIGFSGDTYVNWETLAFQPYFTATAANVAYGWWSHDIGGHMHGVEEGELYARWVQFGVFSPIFRLHSTNNPFHERRPWGYDAETFRVTRQAMQLRHALIPYLYTLAWVNHSTGVAPVRPMYHDYPDAEAAYHCPGQYTFGPDLIAAPFVSPADPDTRLSRQNVWFPPGEWFHFFSGRHFQGGRWQAYYGALEDIPVFARAGAIVPLGPLVDWDGVENPQALNVVIFPGADGEFVLYEDDGQSQAYRSGAHALTRFEQQNRGDGVEVYFVIHPAVGDQSQTPVARRYTLTFRGVHHPDRVQLRRDGQEIQATYQYDAQHHTLEFEAVELKRGQQLEAWVHGEPLLAREDDCLETCWEMVNKFRLETGTKASLAGQLPAILDNPGLLANFTLPLSDSQMRALLEVILEAGVAHIATQGLQERLILWNNHVVPDVSYRLNTFSEHFHHARRLYRPEEGLVPLMHVIPFDELPQRGDWQLSLQYGRTLTVVHRGRQAS